jgi:hypothetical protein
MPNIGMSSWLHMRLLVGPSYEPILVPLWPLRRYATSMRKARELAKQFLVDLYVRPPSSDGPWHTDHHQMDAIVRASYRYTMMAVAEWRSRQVGVLTLTLTLTLTRTTTRWTPSCAPATATP